MLEGDRDLVKQLRIREWLGRDLKDHEAAGHALSSDIAHVGK